MLIVERLTNCVEFPAICELSHLPSHVQLAHIACGLPVTPNLNDTDAKTLWKHYIQLTEAEWAFRIAKDELVLRPIWHHKEDRVKAHILVCFLAYAMWKTLSGWMRRSGLGDAPRSLLDELVKIKSGDIVLPVSVNSCSRTVRLRCVTEPDTEQKLLLHRLGITLPKRLGTELMPPQM